jgi:hypothetical protein
MLFTDVIKLGSLATQQEEANTVTDDRQPHAILHPSRQKLVLIESPIYSSSRWLVCLYFAMFLYTHRGACSSTVFVTLQPMQADMA